MSEIHCNAPTPPIFFAPFTPTVVATGGTFLPFANSITEAKGKSSAAVGVGGLVFIMNAVNNGELSEYQLISGIPTQGLPFQFQPLDNANLTYSLVS